MNAPLTTRRARGGATCFGVLSGSPCSLASSSETRLSQEVCAMARLDLSSSDWRTWRIWRCSSGGRSTFSWREESRGGAWPAALVTALMWIGLGVFASFNFSSTIVSDSKMYGVIGVVFTLVTWFIVMGAVLTLGAVVGAMWERRRGMHGHAD